MPLCPLSSMLALTMSVVNSEIATSLCRVLVLGHSYAYCAVRESGWFACRIFSSRLPCDITFIGGTRVTMLMTPVKITRI